jgi:hypothetical protein
VIKREIEMTARSLLFAVLAAASLSAAAQNIQPGEWEFTTTMTSPMMTQPQVGTVSKCVSKAEADDPGSFMGGNQAAGCIVTRGPAPLGSLSWSVTCEKQGVSGIGKATYGPDKIESEIRMTVALQEGGKKIEMINRTIGRYLGPCAAK